MKVAVLMGSDSDFQVMKDCIRALKKFKVKHRVFVLSAHRSPEKLRSLLLTAEKEYEVLIAGAGKAAHLAGVCAAYFKKPVIGVPIKTSSLNGLDSLYSIVQMPKGVPVATVAINGAYNAGLLAVQILSIQNKELQKKLFEFKKKQEKTITKKNKKIQEKLK